MTAKVAIYQGNMIRSVALARFSTLMFMMLGAPTTYAYNEFVFRSNANLPIDPNSSAFVWSTLIKPRFIWLAKAFGVSDDSDQPPPARKHPSADPKSMTDVYLRTALTFGISSSLYIFATYVSSAYVYRLFLFNPLQYTSQPHSFHTMKIVMQKPNFFGRGVDYVTSPGNLEKTLSGMGPGQRLLANLRETSGTRRKFFYIDWDILKASNRKVWRAFHETVPWVQYKQ